MNHQNTTFRFNSAGTGRHGFRRSLRPGGTVCLTLVLIGLMGLWLRLSPAITAGPADMAAAGGVRDRFASNGDHRRYGDEGVGPAHPGGDKPNLPEASLPHSLQTTANVAVPVELVGQVPSPGHFTIYAIEAMQVRADKPHQIVFATQNQGASCGGGTPAAVWKMTLDPDTGAFVSVAVKQSLSLIQVVRGDLFENSAGVLFTGGGWCGEKPPYYSTDGGETWQPANSNNTGTYPPNSTFSYVEFNGDVYAGTGYEPYHGQIYRWLGDQGPDHWELVLDIPPPRSIVDAMAVYKSRLFVGSHVYWPDGAGCSTSTPVYVSADGRNFEPTTGIPACYTVHKLLVAGDDLVAQVQNYFGPERALYHWDAAASRWREIGPYYLGAGPIISLEGALYAYGRLPADLAAGVYRSVDAGQSWSQIAVFENPNVLAMTAHENVLYLGTEADSNDVAYIYKMVLDPPSPPPPNFIRVVDQAGQPVPGGEVYRNGRAIGLTNEAGWLASDLLSAGDALATLARQAEAFTGRAEHDGWAYRTYLTSQPYTVAVRTGEQRLVVRRDKPLILFNLVVSIEWQADQAYLDDIAVAMKSASDYLYDLTDGQMVFGRVAVFNNGEMWSEADIQIMSKNIVLPHAYIGGLISADKSHVIRLGRFWDGRSGAQGAWSEPAGYRTIAHEFGHYGLHLYDEYIRFEFGENGGIANMWPAVCPRRYTEMDPEQDATNASAMYYHYLSSELSARDAPGMWSEQCEQTAQWQVTERETGRGESAWETLARMYADFGPAPRWRLTTPLDRGGVLAGPDHPRLDLPNWPEITRPAPGLSPRRLTVKGPDGRGFQGAIVALYKQTGRVISQGFTNAQGRLDVFGVEAGDTLRAASMDGDLAGQLIAGNEETLILLLEPVGDLAAQAAEAQPPYLQVRAEPGLGLDQVNLLIALYNFGPSADPSLIVTEPGDAAGFAPPLIYNPTSNAWMGQISFNATNLGLGHIHAAGAVGNNLVRLQTTYRLQRATNDRLQTIYSNDGNLQLYTERSSLPANETYLVVMSPGAIPGPLPEGLALVGDLYDVTASGALVQLEAPAVLALHYNSAPVSATISKSSGLYRWDPYNRRWRKIDSDWCEAQQALVARITILGLYALLTPQEVASEQDFFLPVIMKTK